MGLAKADRSRSAGGGHPRRSAAIVLGVFGGLDGSVTVVIAGPRILRSAFPGCQHGEVRQPLCGIVNARFYG